MAKVKPQAQSFYGSPTGMVQQNPLPIIANRAPTPNDTGYSLGQNWVNQVAGTAYIYTRAAAGLATWALASPGASDVDTINSLSPVAGDILIDGGTNITDVNAGNTVTLNLNNAITLATSVTSPIYTAAAGLAINAPAGNDITIKMGDAGGVNKVSYVDSASVEVFSVDSNGGIGTLTGLTIAGAFAQTAGTFNVGQDNAANAINIGGGTAARAIGIGNSAAPHILTLGSTNTTAQTILQSGTGDLSLTSTDKIDIDSTGTLEINSSAGIIGIGNDAIAQNINIGTGGAARVITIGNVTGATAVNVNSGTGACAWTTTNGSFGLVTGTGAISIGADAVAKNITVGNVTGATAVNVNSGTGACAWTTTNGSFGLVTGTGAINLGTDAAQKILTVGNATGTTSVVVNLGTGNLDLGINATQHNTRIGSATGTSAVTINGGTGAINIGSNATDHQIIIGSATGASGIQLAAGTDDLSLQSQDAVIIGASGVCTVDAVGVLELNSSGAAISIGNDANNFAVNIGTAGARTLTMGSTTGASAVFVNCGTGGATFADNATDHSTTIGSVTGSSPTSLRSGTGDISVVGTVKEITSEFTTRSGDYITFQASPIMQSSANTGAAPTGATGDVNLMCCQEGCIMEQFIIGAGQTIIAPRMDGNGLLASLDLTLAEGAEYNFGAALTNSRHAFTIGTSAAFFFELRFRIADMDGADPYIFGFRKVEANNATWENYTDYAAIGMVAGTSATNVVIADELNSGGTTLTNTTTLWGGDGTINTLKVLVSGAGVVTYTINGAAPAVTHAFTFDGADVVVPFIRLEHSATPSAVNLVWLKIGYQA